MENNLTFGFGADESKLDHRTAVHDDLVQGLIVPPVFKIDYTGYAHKNQMRVGICTAACVTTLAEKFFGDGVKLSMEWLYKMGKTLIDGNTDEGSSIFTMLKIAQKYGIPSEASFPSNCDRTYADFMLDTTITPEMYADAAKHKIPGYASVPVNADSLMKAIYASNNGVATRWAVGNSWYEKADGTVSWDKKDLELLRAPNPVSGGHAISHNAYDNSATYVGGLRNSWGEIWCDAGDIHFALKDQLNYFTEAWVIVGTGAVIFQFTKTLKFGMTDTDIIRLQQFLNAHGFTVAPTGAGSKGKETNFFGGLTRSAVMKFQTAKGLVSDGIVGPMTIGIINNLMKQ